jgi:hypothetical protein
LHAHILLAQAPLPEHGFDAPGVMHGSSTADAELAGAGAGLHSGEASVSFSSFVQSDAHLAMVAMPDSTHWHSGLPEHPVSVLLAHSMILVMQSALGRLHSA